MNRVNANLWTYQFCNTSINGEYLYDTAGNLDGGFETESVSFIVNPLGKILTTSQAILYFLVFFFALFFFLITISLGILLPGGNRKDEMTGYIIATSNIKYVKLFSWAISYLMLMLMFYFGWAVSYGYLDLDFIGNLCDWIFKVMAYGCFIFFPLIIYFAFANAIRDTKINEMISRGLTVNKETI